MSVHAVIYLILTGFYVGAGKPIREFAKFVSILSEFGAGGRGVCGDYNEYDGECHLYSMFASAYTLYKSQRCA